mgnify:CR=1 FL=1
MKLKEVLAKKLTKKELALLPTSFDTVGDIIIFNEFPLELEKKEKLIGQTLLQERKNIQVVAKKVKQYAGKYRLPKLKIIAGKKRKQTIHTESGIKLKLHIEKCYFSSRTSHERLRLSSIVQPPEEILVMFSGIGVIPILLAKKAKSVVGIEFNPIAHQYALENLILNKIKNVQLLQGDVNDIMPTLKNKFDRIIMPLPKEANLYLNLALTKLKPQGTIHLYAFLEENNMEEQAYKLIKESIKDFKITNLVKCGAYAPGVYRVCIEFKTKI